MNRTKKPPPGWMLRVGAFIGHGVFIGHFTDPDGFYFQREMSQAHLRPNETFRELIVREAWEIVDQREHMKRQREIDKANERANAEDDWEFQQAYQKPS